MEHNAWENVFRSINGHRGREEARVALQRMVDRDVLEPGIQDSRMEEHEAQMARGFGPDLVGIACAAALHEVDRRDDVVDAETKEGLADEFGAEFGEIERPENRGFGLFNTGWAGARSDDKDRGARVREGAESLDLFNA